MHLYCFAFFPAQGFKLQNNLLYINYIIIIIVSFILWKCFIFHTLQLSHSCDVISIITKNFAPIMNKNPGHLGGVIFLCIQDMKLAFVKQEVRHFLLKVWDIVERLTLSKCPMAWWDPYFFMLLWCWWRQCKTHHVNDTWCMKY